MSTTATKPLTRPARIDWFRVFVQLERAGYTTRQIALLLDMSHGWIDHLKNSPGAEPRHDVGCLLLELWSEATDMPTHEVPRERPSILRA